VSLLAKGVSLIALTVTMPLAVRCLGPERFGLLSTITTGVALLGFADLGVGNGLLNLVSAAYGRGDNGAARRAVASASLVLSLLAVTAFLAGYCAIQVVPWPRALHLHSSVAVAECKPALLTLLVFFCIGMPASVAQRVQMGYQEGFIANAWTIAAGVITLLGTLAAVYAHAGLPWFVAAVIGGQTLAMSLSWLVEFTLRRPLLFPRLRAVEAGASRTVLRSGLLIFSAQAGASALNAAPAVGLAIMAGAAAVAPFAVLQRVMMVPLALGYAFAAPLWPAYAEAVAVGDYGWIRKTIHRSVVPLAVMVGISAVAMVACRNTLVPLLSGGRLHIGLAMASATGAWMVMASLRAVLSVVANGCGLLGRLAVAVPICAAAAYLPCFLLPHTAAPVEVPPLVTAACELAVVAVIVHDVRKFLGRVEPSRAGLVALPK
jgi:O-antigen/teichoic acid export membrane protein